LIQRKLIQVFSTVNMGTLTGVSVVSNDGESGSEGEDAEERPDEDADEPGDTDKNDED
jgi:hypothetical protein